MKKNQINYLLYHARSKKGVDLKTASTNLGISKLKLSLIEKGYLRPSKKLKPKLIKYYSLSEDFFKKNSRHIYPINKDVVTKKESKLFNFIKSKKTKFISIGLIAVSTLVLGLGFYNLNYKRNNPEAYFSENLKKFREVFPKDPEVLAADDKYTFSKLNESSNIGIEMCLYKNAESVGDSYLSVTFSNYDKENLYSISYVILCTNHKICLVSSLNYPLLNENESTSYIILSYFNNDATLEMYYIMGGIGIELKKGSEEYDKVVTDFTDGVNKSIAEVDTIFQDPAHDFVYKDAKSFIFDVRDIVSNNTNRFRAGTALLFTGAVLFPISLFFLALSFILSYKPRRKKVKEFNSNKIKERKNVKEKEHWWQIFRSKHTYVDGIPYRSIPNDIRPVPFVPETALKILSIVFVIVYSLALNLSIYFRLNVNLIVGDPDLNTFKKYASSFLAGGVLLMFFVKLDINYKRSQKSLMFDIVLYFLLGLVYYLLENFLFIVVGRKEDLFSVIFGLFKNIVPGNIFWSLMLYSSVYYFLFVTPKNLEKDKKKFIGFRLISLIPTGILIFSLIFKSFLSKQANISMFISTIFYSKSALLTMFAVIYLYSVFFLREHNLKKYGAEQCEIYFESSRYNYSKNIIASLIILLLFGFDLWCKYNPSTFSQNLKLGDNWAIVTLIPFLLFYRSHIGKRNKKLDITIQAIYCASLASTYFITIINVINKFDLGIILRFFS